MENENFDILGPITTPQVPHQTSHFDAWNEQVPDQTSHFDAWNEQEELANKERRIKREAREKEYPPMSEYAPEKSSNIPFLDIEDDNPVMLKFGNYYIHKPSFDRNILSIRHEGGNRLAGFPNIPITNNLKKIITMYVNGNKITKGYLDRLSTVDKEILNNLIIQTNFKVSGKGLKKPHGGQQKRLTLIEAEIEAGNNNKSLLREAKYILDNLVLGGYITNQNSKDHIKQLRNFNK